MKHSVVLPLFLLSLLFATYGAHAQQRLGIRVGMNFANVSIKQSDETVSASPDLFTSVSPGFLIGGALEIGLNNHLALQIEPQYVRKGAHIMTPLTPTTELTSWLRLDYIELPVVLKGMMKVRKTTIYGLIGPSVSYNIGAKYDARIEDSTFVGDFRNSFNSADLTLDIGAGFGFDISPNVAFVADCRYSMGLINTLREYNPSGSTGYQRSSDMKVAMGLLFGL